MTCAEYCGTTDPGDLPKTRAYLFTNANAILLRDYVWNFMFQLSIHWITCCATTYLKQNLLSARRTGTEELRIWQDSTQILSSSDLVFRALRSFCFKHKCPPTSPSRHLVGPLQGTNKCQPSISVIFSSMFFRCALLLLSEPFEETMLIGAIHCGRVWKE